VCAVGIAVGARSVLYDATGHPALIRASERLARAAGVTAIAVSPEVLRAPALLEAQLRVLPAPAVFALSWVQHETGAIANVKQFGEIMHRAGGLLCLDAVQALGKLPMDLATTGACAAAISGHKIGGPSGAGAVWIRSGTRAEPLTTGGMQERGLRPGTENVLGLVGFGAACQTLGARLDAMPAVAKRRDALQEVLRSCDGVVINGEDVPRVPTVVHASVRDVPGEELVAALDLEGVSASAGPACTSGRGTRSPAILAMHPNEPWRAASSLRLSLGPETRDEEIAYVCSLLPRVIARARSA
jgi:cysteine desulfurase